MTIHTVYAEHLSLGGWAISLPGGGTATVPRLCDVEGFVRLHLQQQYGDVSEDTIDVKIGGRRRGGSNPPDPSKRFIPSASRKRKSPRRH